MSPAEQAARPHTVREVEHKFRVHGLFCIPDLTEVSGISAVDDLGTVDLETTYYDTDDLRLAREDLTLRRRTGDDEGWHLKIPVAVPKVAGGGARDELRLPLDAGSPGEPPAALLDVVRVVVRDQPVRAVATLGTQRRRRLLRGAHDAPIAELVDDNVQVVETNGTVAARFRELELEERDNGKAVDKAIGRISGELTTAGAVGGEFVAKAVRALGPRAAAPAEVPEPEFPGPKDAAGDCVAAYLVVHLRALRASDVEFRRDPDDPGDSVHQLRVAARRLRSGLRVFRPLLDRAWAEELRTELRWFAHGLSDLRESEVMRARLLDHITDLRTETPDVIPGAEVAQLVDETTQQALDRARSLALGVLASERYLALHDRLVVAAREPSLGPAADEPARDVLPGLVRGAWKRLARAAADLSPDAPDDDWHAARLAAKRTRYAAEAVAPVLGDDAAAFAERVERVTDVLGEHQDAVQAAAAVQRLAVDPGTANDLAFALGGLAAAERERAAAARARFAEIWPDVRRSSGRTWMS